MFEIFRIFLKLGSTSFGGPVAHIGFFHGEFVERRKWLTEEQYADFVALCQFLPGPASSQLGFAVGISRGGIPGGLAAWLGFTLPSAVLMVAFAYFIGAFAGIEGSAWLQGLKVAAVAVVARAVWSMGVNLCPDGIRATIALVAAMAVVVLPNAITQIGVIVGGGIAGWVIFGRRQDSVQDTQSSSGVRKGPWGVFFLGAFFLLLAGLPTVAAFAPSPWLQSFESFYRSGSLVFGGGHVVLPLLQAEVVPTGWIHQDSFLAGYGAAQAVPGPLFAFSAYLGTAMTSGPGGWVHGVWCLVAIFLPSGLLVMGVLPFWERLRHRAVAQAALKGTNASVVGLLLAALYSPVWTNSIRDRYDFTLVLAAFALLEIWQVPAWLVVILCAFCGVLFL